MEKQALLLASLLLTAGSAALVYSQLRKPQPVAEASFTFRGGKADVKRIIEETFVRLGFHPKVAMAAVVNAQAESWCTGQAADRPCPEDTAISVREAFASEQPRLLTLPENPFPTEEQLAVKAGKTPYVRFDLNDYSIPHTHVQRLLTIRANPDRVRVLDGGAILADHPRSYGSGDQVEKPEHIKTLIERKRQARHHRGQDHLTRAAPASRDLLIGAAERGGNLGTITAALLRLLDRYGAAELQAAILDALAAGVPHPNAVGLALERRREARDEAPPVATCLPPHVKQKDAPVLPHRLDTYDQLTGDDDEPS